MNKKVILLVVLLLCLIDVEVFAQGCSQCKLVSEQATELDEASFGTNINYGILYLMIIPYILLMFLFRNRIKGLFLSLTKNLRK
ncbi:hypothetical protein N9E20_02825 [Crocinitomicaceae bacterium]|jgi:hypothetical protein|nr:hypothetical protein [Crocinitomicaceae bacterium]